MPKYRIIAESIIEYEVIVEAKTYDEALEKANDLDASEFDVVGMATWDIIGGEKCK